MYLYLYMHIPIHINRFSFRYTQTSPFLPYHFRSPYVSPLHQPQPSCRAPPCQLHSAGYESDIVCFMSAAASCRASAASFSDANACLSRCVVIS